MSAAALERQIKLIYDAIDSGQYKSALQSCIKQLKKQPKNDLIKALKALALVRMGKVEEGVVVCDEVLATSPTDEQILGAMQHVLRNLSRHDEMATMFETAYKKYPQNDEYGAQAFMANVRLGNWKGAQQLATKLYKGTKDDRYLYWNVMCIILQASEVMTSPQTQPILLQLALRVISTSPYPSTIIPERFYLHLSLLRDLQKYDEALKLLDTDVARGLCDTSLQLEDVRHAIAMAAGRKEEEYTLAKDRLVSKQDRNWITFLKLINCTLERVEEQDVLADARTTLDSLAEVDGSSERGSLLARLELENRIRHSQPNSPKINFVEILKRYFDTFKGKSSCFEDLKNFSIILEGEEVTQWRAFLEEQDVTAPSSLPQLSHQLNALKLHRWCLVSEEITVELEESLAQKYLRAYAAALPLGRTLPKTEIQPADDLAILTASSLISLHLLTNSRSYLSCAATVLEYALIRSPQGFQHRLLLIRLYRLLGAPGLALDHYKKLGIKQIQQDSMVHFILGRCATFSLAAIGDLTYLQECIESTNIYSANTSETPDMVIKAFQYEKYSQVPEFIEFEDRLDISIQRDLTKMEHVRMRLTHEVANAETIDLELLELKFLYERSTTHYDNRDFTVIPEFQPHGQSMDLQITMGGVSPGGGWLQTWMKMYILVLEMASDLDPGIDGHILLGEKFTQIFPPEHERPPLKDRIRDFNPSEEKELTEQEKRLKHFTLSLMQWLKPHNDYSRPSSPKPIPESALQSFCASTVIATPNTKLLKAKPDTEDRSTATPPPTVDPPSEVTEFFNTMYNEFKTALENDLPWRSMHISTLVQEGFVLFNIVTARFRLGGGSKMKKGELMMHHMKSIRDKAICTLKSMSADLIKAGEADATVEGRRQFVEETKLVQCVDEITHDFCLDVAKKVTDARKRIREGLGRGFERICKVQGQGLPMTS